VTLGGDGGGSLVEALAARGDSDEVSVLLWSLTLDQTKASGSPALARDVSVAVTGLTPGSTYTLRHDRVDDAHSDIATVWGRMREDDQAWPTDDQWAALREADRLEQLEPDRSVTADETGHVTVEFPMPMPAMSQLTLTPSPS
jgi:xylan 1,4-beta-xylosidase